MVSQDGQLTLHGARKGRDLDFALRSCEGSGLSTPECLDGFYVAPYLLGAISESLGAQSEVVRMPARSRTKGPTRPSDRLSTTAHSSAMRAGWCSGETTEPARSAMLRVSGARRPQLRLTGFGYRPPKS